MDHRQWLLFKKVANVYDASLTPGKRCVFVIILMTMQRWTTSPEMVWKYLGKGQLNTLVISFCCKHHHTSGIVRNRYAYTFRPESAIRVCDLDSSQKDMFRYMSCRRLSVLSVRILLLSYVWGISFILFSQDWNVYVSNSLLLCLYFVGNIPTYFECKCIYFVYIIRAQWGRCPGWLWTIKISL